MQSESEEMPSSCTKLYSRKRSKDICCVPETTCEHPTMSSNAHRLPWYGKEASKPEAASFCCLTALISTSRSIAIDETELGKPKTRSLSALSFQHRQQAKQRLLWWRAWYPAHLLCDSGKCGGCSNLAAHCTHSTNSQPLGNGLQTQFLFAWWVPMSSIGQNHSRAWHL